MGQVLSLPFKLLKTTHTYVRGLLHYLWGPGRYQPYSATAFRPLAASKTDTTTSPDDDEKQLQLFQQQARIHLYTLASNFYLYDKPHYRKGSFRSDLRDNLRNVAIPGTGLPLSIPACSRWLTALPFLLTVYPTVSLVASVHQWIQTRGATSISQEYATRLLAPNDWFSYWRQNCAVVGLHALLNNDRAAVDYDMENKWEFLVTGQARGVPVSPYLKEPTGLVVKHRNEEGGMGIFFYKNANSGGDWILQARIDNSAWVSSLLPDAAPLSTFRVITCSRVDVAAAADDKDDKPPSMDDIKALSCVFRAGRAGAATDHDSILFDIDVQTGKIQGGTTNAHWYRLGLWNGVVRGPSWRSKNDTYTHHPDCSADSKPVTGQTVPDIHGMLKLVQEAHLKLCPRVPLAGWDVVLSADPKLPVCLLEVNLSCNFFRGSFDQQVYLDFLDETLSKLQDQRLQADAQKKKFKVNNP